MNKILITTALLLAMGAMPAKAVTITFCGPQTEGGSCEGANETKVFLNEGHSETSGSGTVGNGKGAPVLLFSVDGGAFDTRVDTGGGFANITSANADSKNFAGFNGTDIIIPGFRGDRLRRKRLGALVEGALARPAMPRSPQVQTPRPSGFLRAALLAPQRPGAPSTFSPVAMRLRLRTAPSWRRGSSFRTQRRHRGPAAPRRRSG